MSTLRVALTALICLILTAHLSGSEPTLVPQPGVLLLRNGRVLAGEISRAGDYYVVMLGPASEIRMPATEVETPCKSLEEAYLWKLSRLDPTNYADRLALAEWCLRHELAAQAEGQLEIVRQVRPDHPRLKLIEQRLEVSQRQPTTYSPTSSMPNVATVGSEQLDKTTRDLPNGSMEKFTAVVQPLLINRCGANGCHGPNSKNDFQLLKPAPGQVANRRFTQRNLYSALLFVDRDEPQNSPLLIMPQKRHGGTAAPVFDEHTRDQFELVAAWVQMTVAKPEARAPASIDPSGALLSPAISPQARESGASSPPASQAAETEKADPTSAEQIQAASASDAGKEKSAAGQPFVPRDPFDPEIFNRRYFSGK